MSLWQARSEKKRGVRLLVVVVFRLPSCSLRVRVMRVSDVGTVVLCRLFFSFFGPVYKTVYYLPIVLLIAERLSCEIFGNHKFGERSFLEVAHLPKSNVLYVGDFLTCKTLGQESRMACGRAVEYGAPALYG